MTSQSFADAQQAANTAYAMTLEQTGDVAQAADDYKAVMTAYYAATNQQAYDADFYGRIIAARKADPKQHDANQVCLSDMMLLTGRIDHAQWIAEI